MSSIIVLKSVSFKFEKQKLSTLAYITSEFEYFKINDFYPIMFAHKN